MIKCFSTPSTFLELNGEDWRPRPLKERKAMLGKILAKALAGIEFSEHLGGDGVASIRPEQSLAQDQESGCAWRATVPGSDLSHARPRSPRRPANKTTTGVI
jgi:hypothetical protein